MVSTGRGPTPSIARKRGRSFSRSPPRMTKRDVLVYLADVGEADARRNGSALGVPYATSAMAALRLVRQHLATRAVDPAPGTLRLPADDHGHARLAFFEDAAHSNRARPRRARRGDIPFQERSPPDEAQEAAYRDLSLPACFIELDLVAEESLKCDQCGGPLATGSLDEVWADDEEDEGVVRPSGRRCRWRPGGRGGSKPSPGLCVRLSLRVKRRDPTGSQQP